MFFFFLVLFFSLIILYNTTICLTPVVEYGNVQQKWKAPVMDTGEPASGTHRNDIGWNDDVILTAKGKANYVTGQLIKKTKKTMNINSTSTKKKSIWISN